MLIASTCLVASTVSAGTALLEMVLGAMVSREKRVVIVKENGAVKLVY